jgi:NADPH-dependent 7-cyano-7-deazaguanine reductase QueF
MMNNSNFHSQNYKELAMNKILTTIIYGRSEEDEEEHKNMNNTKSSSPSDFSQMDLKYIHDDAALQTEFLCRYTLIYRNEEIAIRAMKKRLILEYLTIKMVLNYSSVEEIRGILNTNHEDFANVTMLLTNCGNNRSVEVILYNNISSIVFKLEKNYIIINHY